MHFLLRLDSIGTSRLLSLCLYGLCYRSLLCIWSGMRNSRTEYVSVADGCVLLTLHMRGEAYKGLQRCQLHGKAAHSSHTQYPQSSDRLHVCLHVFMLLARC